MEDKKLVRQLAKKNEKALVVLIERYSAYVSTVVRNIVSGGMSINNKHQKKKVIYNNYKKRLISVFLVKYVKKRFNTKILKSFSGQKIFL